SMMNTFELILRALIGLLRSKAAVPTVNPITGIFNPIGGCLCSMMNTFELILRALIGLFRSKAALHADGLVLRHPLNILRRKSPKRFVLTGADRAVFVALYCFVPGVMDALAIIRPETVIRWQRAGFRRFWRWKSRRGSGRPKVSVEIRKLIREMSVANPL